MAHKADPKGTPAQQWAARVEYKGPRQADHAQVGDSRRCVHCQLSSFITYSRRDGGYGVSLICYELSTPGEKGLTVQERATCTKWGRKL